jgi:hypothetical protein
MYGVHILQVQIMNVTVWDIKLSANQSHICVAKSEDG